MDVNLFLMAALNDLLDPLVEAHREFTEVIYGTFAYFTGTFAVVLPLFVVVLILTTVGRRFLASWTRQLFWTFVLIRLVLPASFVSPLSLGSLCRSIKAVAKLNQRPLALTIEQTPLDFPVSPPAIPSSNSGFNLTDRPSSKDRQSLFENFFSTLTASLQTLQFSGSLLILGLMLVSAIRVIRHIGNSTRVIDETLLELIDEGRRRFQIRPKVRILVTHQFAQPMTFDWLWPAILVPEQFLTMPVDQQRQTIWHEMARLRRGDSWFSLFDSAVYVLHWWNPIFWWTQRCWLRERELACDQAVVNQLSVCESADLCQMIQRFKQKPQSIWQSWFHLEPPGFISGIETDRVLRSRIRNISAKHPLEGRARYALSWTVILVVAIAGLTDAPTEPNENTPIELPRGTVWPLKPSGSDTHDLVEARSYFLTDCIARLCRDEPMLSNEAAAQIVHESVSRLLASTIVAESHGDPDVVVNTTQEVSCHLSGDQLTVQATPATHERITNLISAWTERGRRSIAIEVRMLSTKLDISQLMPDCGGAVINSSGLLLRPNLSSGSSLDRPSALSVRGHGWPISTYVHCLERDQALRTFKKLCGDIRSCGMFAPKVTIVDGNTVNVVTGVGRPFATGYIQNKLGTLEPDVKTVHDGFKIHVFAFSTSEDRLFLNVAFSSTWVDDVTVRILNWQSKSLPLQVPTVHELTVETHSEVGSGDTLAIVPLQRDAGGHLGVVVITPRQLELDEEEEPLLELPRY